MQVAARLHAVALAARDAADKLQQQRLLHVVVAEDLRRNALGQLVVKALVVRELADRLDALGAEGRVLLLGLRDLHGLEEGVGRQAGLHGLVARVGRRQEDAADGHNVARQHAARGLAAAHDRHGARDVADGHLFGKLLHLYLLVLLEAAAARHHRHLADAPALNALLRDAARQRHELLARHLLVELAAAHFALVGCDEDVRLDVSCAQHDGTHRHELA